MRLDSYALPPRRADAIIRYMENEKWHQRLASIKKAGREKNDRLLLNSAEHESKELQPGTLPEFVVPVDIVYTGNGNPLVGGRVHEVAITQVNANVVATAPAFEKDQISRQQVVSANRYALHCLLASGAWQFDAVHIAESHTCETGTIDASAGSAASPIAGASPILIILAQLFKARTTGENRRLFGSAGCPGMFQPLTAM